MSVPEFEMSRAWYFAVGALAGVIGFFLIAGFGLRAGERSMKQDCDKLGAVVIDGIVYECRNTGAQR